MKGRFVALTKDEEKRLFAYEFQGPLADFSSRIKLGYAMYLFGRETREDMEIIRRVRNLFAHQSAVMTFKLPEIEETCQHLSIVRDRTIVDARGRYCAACIAIANRIQSGVIRRTTKWDPSWATPKPPHDLP